MRAEDRKAAIAAYKKRKSCAGIYQVRCAVTGEAWIGQCGDVSAIQNRIWFTLRLGSCPDKSLQQSWASHGADAFSLEILERVDEDDAYIRNARLKERAAHWRDRCRAQAI